MMRISVFTLFPELITVHASTSLLGRARERGVLEVVAHDLRSHGTGVHRAVDDAPFGGGAGMVLAPGPIFDAVEARLARGDAHRPLVLLSPSGRRFDQSVARSLVASLIETSTHSTHSTHSTRDGSGGMSFLCGRYEGFDQRIHDHLVDDEISIGDFVLGGGEVAAMVITEAVARLVPGVMGNASSAVDESFSDGLLEYPHYTRPAVFRGWAVPDVLRSGDHAEVKRWRRAEALARTLARRPDLLGPGTV